MTPVAAPVVANSGAPGPRPLRVAVVTNVLPHYRADFYRRLFKRAEVNATVFCQAAIPGMNLTLAHDQFADRVTIVPATSLKGEAAAWQWLPWHRLLTAFDVLFVYGNPRVVSNIALGALARIMSKPVVLWGQAHTAGAHQLSERLRLWWWRRFKYLFVYNDGEVRWLRDRGFERQHIAGMNNGLDQRRIDNATLAWNEARLSRWRSEQGVADRTQVLSCARLEPKNRFDLWLTAMPAVVESYPDLLWCVIGDGRERQALEAQANRLGLGSHVRWLGSMLDEDTLAPWFLSCRVLVHPAGIGLTLLHAFGYGLPVVTHDDAETQMPEFHAFVSGETGLSYPRDDANALAQAVGRCLGDDVNRRRMGERARRIAREDHNVDVMVDRFVAMAIEAGGAG